MSDRTEKCRKARVLESMAGVIAANWDGYALKENVPGYAQGGKDIESVGIFHRHRLLAVRLVDAECGTEQPMQDIVGRSARRGRRSGRHESG